MPRKSKQNLPGNGQGRRVHKDHVKFSVPRQSNGGADDHLKNVGNDHARSAAAPPPDLAAVISDIRAWHRQRVFAMDQRKRSDLALGAFLRGRLGWSRELPKDESAAINKKALESITIGEKIVKQETKFGVRNKLIAGEDEPFFVEWSGLVLGSLRGRVHYAEIEDKAVVEMDRLARLLPVAPWFLENVFRTEAKSLAVIVAETGDLSGYANPGKLWKRMGLAVMDGVRQGGLRKGADKEDWIRHGYSAKRRSLMFVIGDSLLKANKHYRSVYLQRKADLRDRAKERGLIVAPSAKIPANRKAEFISDGHIHKDSQRYMEKRLLRNLWSAWRRATTSLQPTICVPAANYSAQAERPATKAMKTNYVLPGESIPAKAGKRRAQRDVTSSLDLPTVTSSAKAERSARIQMKPISDLPSESIPAKAGKRKANAALLSVIGMPSAINPQADP